MKNRVLFALAMGAMLASPKLQASENPKSNPVETVEFVDLNKYLGKWHEVASIPQSFQKKCIRNTTAEYSFAEKNRLRVLNSCEMADGNRMVAEGRAKIADTKSNSKLKVTFLKIGGWIFAASGDYWILDIDADYQIALIGDPSREYAWILSRTPVLSKEKFAQSEAHFRSQGYDTCKILMSVQTGGLSERVPLCEWVREI